MNQAWTGLGLVGIVVLASTGHGCATVDEGDYTDPPGFSPAHTQAVALSKGGFVRDEQNTLLTSTLSAQRQTREAERLSLDARSVEQNDRLRLSAEFHGSYADGVTVAAASQPRASLRVLPVAAQQAHARLRNDGAIVAFEDAFPHVTSAFGARSSRLEEFLVVNDAHDVPTLAYDLVAGPDFDHLEEGDEGDPTLWAYARDGEGVFTILPPSADDAAGRHVEGSWKLDKTAQGYRITAQLDLEGMQYPVLIDPTFETPQWFRNTASAPSPRMSVAGAYDISSKCIVLFGGAADTSSFTPIDDVSLRCANRTWSAKITTVAADSTVGKPVAREHASLAYNASLGKVILFGGRAKEAVLNDTWSLTLNCSTPGVASSCTGTWTKIATSGPTPDARTLQGMAWDGTRTLMFGGVLGNGAGARDTWAFDGSQWTQLCSTCFGGSNGIYGFASATTVVGSTRNVYVAGGYTNPLSYGPYFSNTVYRWSNGSWIDVSGNSQVIPEYPDADRGTSGATVIDATAADLAPQPRYLNWLAATGNGSLLFGGGFSATTPAAPAVPVTQYYGDSWLWLSSAKSGVSNQWMLLPRPRTVVAGPGVRESGTAVYDENYKELVLIGGLKADQTTLVSDGRVYRSPETSFQLLQSCADSGCSGVNLTVVINGVTTASECGNYTVQFLAKSTSTNPWANRGALGTTNTFAAPTAIGLLPSTIGPEFNDGTAKCTVTSAYMIAGGANYGARVRNNAYHRGGANCLNDAPEITENSTQGACINNLTSFVGLGSCGGQVVDGGTPYDSCDDY